MKQTIGFYEFARAFEEVRPTNFSCAGLAALFDYLEEIERDIGEEMEFDVIGLCCDYTESTWAEAAQAYGQDLDTIEDYLSNNTQWFRVDDDTIIYLAF